MKPRNYTRYFLFARVDPKKGDIVKLVRTCQRIDAYMGCKKLHSRGRDRLVGFILLRGVRAYANQICREFPNFLVTPMPGHGWESAFDEGFYDLIVGRHPFADLRRKLF